MGDESILEVLKPTYRDGIFMLAGALIDRFGVSYVLDKYKEFKARENEELAKRIAAAIKEYKSE
jgi:hypothetical protein